MGGALLALGRWVAANDAACLPGGEETGWSRAGQGAAPRRLLVLSNGGGDAPPGLGISPLRQAARLGTDPRVRLVARPRSTAGVAG